MKPPVTNYLLQQKFKDFHFDFSQDLLIIEEMPKKANMTLVSSNNLLANYLSYSQHQEAMG